jgi:transmembrane sensor
MEDQMLIRYLKNNLAPAEITEVEQWLKVSAENQTYFNDLKTLWAKTGEIPELASPDIDKAWNRLNTSVTKRSLKTRYLQFAKIAAVAMLFLASYFILRTQFSFLQSEKFVTITSGDSIRQIVLADSSIIWLNKHSELAYNEQFNLKRRNVKLSGEAFFKVHRDEHRPFIIKTVGSTVQVLGTSFNVKAPASSKVVSVSVVTGKVSFTDNTDKSNHVILTHNDVAELTPGQTIKVNEVSAINENAWLTNKLIFQNQTLAEVFHVISDYYHVNIVSANDDIARARITTSFDHQTLEQVINVLSVTTSFKYKIQQKEIVFFK